jgi:DNA-directed RNA polymerase specialized sigma24 family protein
MEQVDQAYVHLHDLDWLQECDLARLPEVQQSIQRHQTMPEAQALRGLLIAAARQVIGDMGEVPGKQGLAAFLKGYLAGRSVAEIAQELGVSREWCSRKYRREALRLAGMQFVRSMSSVT